MPNAISGWGEAKGVVLMACLMLVAPQTAALATQEATASAEDQAWFREQVWPILESNCVGCHGQDGKRKGGLDLTNRAGLLKGGDLGPAVDSEEPGASLILDAVNYLGPEMPPKGKLSGEQIQVLTQWVERGAPWDGAAGAPAEAMEEEAGFRIRDEHRAFWSFQPIKRPELPEVEQKDWVRNPIDQFILRSLEDLELSPAPPADRVALLRRLYHDLIGLPPTPEQVDAFLADTSPDAYERRVEELLESPQYGVRWGRHWLDVVRFAETNSFERDGNKPFAWRYRDYVIDSFNADKPYDQFVKEQLAGDELDQVTPESITATGFYRLGAWDDEPTDRLQARYDELDDIVTTTAQTFLGLTINCARCHDHKIDPISQADYYKTVAFLQNMKSYSYAEDHVLTEIATPEERARFERENQERLAKEKEILEALRPLEERMLAEVPEPRKSKLRDEPDFGRRKHVYDDLASRVLDDEARGTFFGLAEAWANLPKPAPLPQALSVREQGGQAPETFVLIRGSAATPGDKVEPGFPEVLGFEDPVLSTPDPSASSCGRRRVLAEWIASPENPLTARVMINRIWQHHFGRGIVRSPNDFGLQGDAPTHPELLDWLASEFIAEGWRMKPMHRLMVTSNAYRMSSRGNAKALETDPTNDLFWRFNLRRLGAEEVRDSILAVTGELNLEMGGPGVYPRIPKAYLAGQSRPGDGWGQSPPDQQVRRSAYIHVKRSLLTPILASFDVADTDFTCPVRFATTQPTQALSTLNGEFLNEQARVLAARLNRECGDDLEAKIRRGLRLVIGREPSAAELERGRLFLETVQKDEGAGPDHAFDLFCLMLLNLNEFMYID